MLKRKYIFHFHCKAQSRKASTFWHVLWVPAVQIWNDFSTEQKQLVMFIKNTAGKGGAHFTKSVSCDSISPGSGRPKPEAAQTHTLGSVSVGRVGSASLT